MFYVNILLAFTVFNNEDFNLDDMKLFKKYSSNKIVC